MTPAQKTIKYFALALASLIIVGIFSGIVFGGLGLLTAVGLIKADTHVDTVCESNDNACLVIAISRAELEVKPGSELKVETEDDKVEISQDGNKLSIKENGNRWFADHAKITIFVPDDLIFDKVGIGSGVGSIEFDSLKAKNLKASLGIGNATFTNLSVAQADFNCGIGRLEVSLAESSSAYEIKVDKGIGSVEFNGKTISNNTTLGSGAKNIKLSGGIGEIVINTKE